MTALHIARITVALCVAGCAAGESATRHGRHAEAPGDRSLASEASHEQEIDPSQRISDGTSRAPTTVLRDAAPRGVSPVRIGADVAPRVRPPRHKRIDLDLKGAPLGDALRFIADSGGFNLVVEGELGAQVSLRLRAVDAFDALTTLAEAEGLQVTMERGIVIVTGRGSARLADGAAP